MSKNNKYKMSEADYLQGTESYEGICLACGAIAECVEPDVDDYECGSCGSLSVHGLEEALLMGHIEIS